MKKALLCSFIILFVLVNVVSNTKNSKMAMEIVDNLTLEKVIEVEVDKDEIIKKLEEWIKLNFDDKNDEIKEINKEKYFITGFGNLILTWISPHSYATTNNHYFEYKFDIKDKKFKFSITNIFNIQSYKQYTGERFIDTGNVQKRYISGDKELKMISQTITDKGTIEDLKNFVNGVKKEKSDW